MTIRVAVVGAAGRMGSTVCQAVQDAEGLELVARLDVGDTLDAEHLAGADVAVDFTVPSVTEANVHALLDAGVDVVVGTTGWTEESYGRIREHLAQPEAAGRSVLIAPNFALSAVLAMSFAAKAAPYFESAEVIELHHPNKVDAPSGTAVATAQGIAAARAETGLGAMPDATQTDPDGARGAVVDGVHVHAVRLDLLRVDVGVEDDDAALEAAEPLGDAGADEAEPDEADGAFPHVAYERLVGIPLHPLALLQEVVAARDVLVLGDHHPDGEVGHRVGRPPGRGPFWHPRGGVFSRLFSPTETAGGAAAHSLLIG